MQSDKRERQFDELYATQRQTLHAYFLGKTADAELARDLVQDTFVRVWRNLPTVADLPPERRIVWLHTVARNLVVDQYRARATQRATTDALQREAAAAHLASAAADVDLTHRERLDTVDAAIRRLPEDLRVVLVLSVLGERNSTEIGELLGRPPGTVRYQLAEARRRLAREPDLQELLRP